MRHLARFLLVGLIVASVILLAAYSYLPVGNALPYLGARVG